MDVVEEEDDMKGGEEGGGEEEYKEEDVEQHLSHVERGILLLGRGDVDRAAREFEEAYSIDGHNADAIAWLGVVTAVRHRHEKASSLFHKALTIDPGCITALCHLGHQQECHYNDPAQAAQLYRKAIALRPSEGMPHYALATVLQDRLADPVGARRSFLRAVQLQPSSVEARIDAARQLLSAGEARASRDLVGPALRLRPDNPLLILTHAHAEWRVDGDASVAAVTAGRAVALSPQDASVLCEAGLLLGKSGATHHAEQLYRQAMAVAPDNALPASQLGMMFVEGGGRHSEAQMLLQTALRIVPSDPTILASYADLLRGALQDYDEADEYYAKALEESPYNSEIVTRYALMLGVDMLRNESSPARIMVLQRRSGELFQRAVLLRPSYSAFQYNLAAHYERVQHDYDKARDHYKLAVECEEPHPEAYFSLGYVLQYHIRDYAEAEACYQACLRSQPLHVTAMCSYGLLLCNSLKRYRSARRVLGRVLELSPSDPDAALGLKFVALLERAAQAEAGGDALSD